MSKIQYIGGKNQIEQVFNTLKQQAYILVDSGKKLTLELAEFKNKRSKAQNDYYWVICSDIAKFLRKACPPYIDFTKDLIHDKNKRKFDVETTTKMSIHEFYEYMNEVIEYWNERTDRNWFPPETPQSYMENRGYVETQEK